MSSSDSRRVLARMDWNDSLREGSMRGTKLLRHKEAWETTYVSCAHPYTRWAEGLLACLMDSEAGDPLAVAVRDAWRKRVGELTVKAVKERLKT